MRTPVPPEPDPFDELPEVLEENGPFSTTSSSYSNRDLRTLRFVAIPALLCATIVIFITIHNDEPWSFSSTGAPSAPPLPPLPPSPPTTPRPIVPLIVDTDMAFDVDDVGALCVAHALADKGEADLLLVVHDAGPPEGIGAVAAINEFYGRSATTKLGAYQGPFAAGTPGPYISALAHQFRTPVVNYSYPRPVPKCGDAYREALSRAAPRSVTIAAIGYMMCLRDLLMSKPDAHSPLDGRALVAAKVERIVFQGGWYKPLHEDGKPTFNWDCGGPWVTPDHTDCTGASHEVISRMPESVELIYSDMGDEVMHGGPLYGCAPTNSPCRDAYLRYLGPGVPRPSWDPIVVTVAVRGPSGIYGHLTDKGWRNTVDETGRNFWAPTERNDTRQSQFIFDGDYPWRRPRAMAGRLLDELLCSREHEY